MNKNGEACKRWRETHKEYDKARQIKWRQENPDKNAAKSAHWRSKNPEKAMLMDTKSRSKRAGIPFDIDINDINIPEKCPVLGIELTRTGSRDSLPSLDKKIPSLGYVKGNVAVISMKANRMKSDATAEELQAILNYLLSAPRHEFD